MGVLYIPLALDEQTREWLSEADIPVSARLKSRLPSLSNIKEALSQLDGYVVEGATFELGHPMQIDISTKAFDSHTTLNIERLEEKDNELLFEKGDPYLIALIVKLMSEHTGPLVLTTDSGDLPLLITPDTDIEAMVDEWLGIDDEPEPIHVDAIKQQLLAMGLSPVGKRNIT